MLPSFLSEQFCSLNTNHDCFAISMRFEIDLLANTLEKIETKSCLIRVQHTFDYETPVLLSFVPYQHLLQITRTFQSDIRDSHSLVAFWMIQMNREIAKELHQKKIGIFRISSDPGGGGRSFLFENAIPGKYVCFSEDQTVDYTHFTSPIRRMVDIYNQLVWLGLNTKDHFDRFDQLFNIEKINEDTKTIRKIQMKSKILSWLPDSPVFTKGTILNIQEKQITLYLSEYNMIVYCKNTANSDLVLNGKNECECKIYKFDRELDYRKKIKIAIL
jgi:exoribonuclease R